MYTGEPDGTGETQRQPISTIKQCVRKLQTLSREVAVSHLVWTNSDPKRTCSCWAGRGQTSEGERVRQQEQQPGRGKAQCIADWQQYTVATSVRQSRGQLQVHSCSLRRISLQQAGRAIPALPSLEGGMPVEIQGATPERTRPSTFIFLGCLSPYP